jgi:hyperosmotically inducible protein
MMKKIVASLFGGVLLMALSIAFAPGYQQKVSAATLSNSARAIIAREVRHELVTLPFYSVFDNLAFRVDDDGTVVLMGQVAKPVLKDDAERAVKRIEGVTRVKNEIEVLPLSPDDDRIRIAEFRAIYGDPALNRYEHQAVPPIHIIVKNGHVSLEGVVATQADKNIAGIRANSVPGVFSVMNNLRVEKE